MYIKLFHKLLNLDINNGTNMIHPNNNHLKTVRLYFSLVLTIIYVSHSAFNGCNMTHDNVWNNVQKINVHINQKFYF
jgi:hypothetical protein